MAPTNALPLGLLLFLAVVQCSAGFCSRPGYPTRVAPPRDLLSSTPHHETLSMLFSGKDDDAEGEETANEKEKEREGLTWAELQADPEMRELEFQRSMQRRNNLFLPQRISAAVTTLGWIFVAGGIILNQLGYAWVKDPSGGLGVGTLDERDFQREVIRERRRANEEAQQPITVSEVGNTNKYISSWIGNGEDTQIG